VCDDNIPKQQGEVNIFLTFFERFFGQAKSLSTSGLAIKTPIMDVTKKENPD
jgi:hypothetical protein